MSSTLGCMAFNHAHFNWKKRYHNVRLAAITAGEEVVEASELLGGRNRPGSYSVYHQKDKKARDSEIRGGVRPDAKMNSACTLIAKRREIAPVIKELACHLRSCHGGFSGYWTARTVLARGNRRDNAADAGLLSRSLAVTDDLPCYRRRRVRSLLRRPSRSDSVPSVKAKRVHRIMPVNRRLLLHNGPRQTKPEHEGIIPVF